MAKNICKTFLTLFMCALVAVMPGRSQHSGDAIPAGMTYQGMKEKAERFFKNREWNSADAVYGIMLNERGDTPDIYGRAIVAAEMHNDTLRVAHLLKQSMSHGVAFEETFHAVEQSSLEVGDGAMYERFLLQARDIYPYLTRPINSYLLRYYEFHNNGSAMVDYARRMLDGIPDNVDYLSVMARGYEIQGDMKSAVDTWLRIITIEPDNRVALLSVANYYMLTGNSAEALPYLRRVASLYPTPYIDNLLHKAQSALKKL